MRRRALLRSLPASLVVGAPGGGAHLRRRRASDSRGAGPTDGGADGTARRDPVSVRAALEDVGWWRRNRPPRSRRLPSGAATWPSSGSLEAALRATASPRIGSWDNVFDGELTGDWTPGCQGLAFHGRHLFVTQNSAGVATNRPRKGIYKLDRDWNVVDTHVKTGGVFESKDGFSFEGGSHWGDVEAHDGTLYVALENVNRIVEMDPGSLTVLSSKPLKAPPSAGADRQGKNYPHDGGDAPWCAIHPWNGYLYTSNFGGVEAAYAYDPDDGYRRVPEATVHLEPVRGDRPVGVQGGGFSRSGHLYLSSYTKTGDQTHDWESEPDESDWLFAFDALTGSYMGRKRIPAEAGGATGQELEGLTVQPGIAFGGDGASVHTVLLDRNTTKNSVHFKAFSVPSDAQL